MAQYIGKYSLHNEADGTNGFRIDGVDSNSFLGFTMTTGDVNGDGYADLLMSAVGANSGTGSLYVVYGGASGFSNHTVATLAYTWNGGSGEGIGRQVGFLGDINHDGFGDFAVGSDLTGAGGNGGKEYVVFGSATGPVAPVDLTTLSGSSTGFLIAGSAGALVGAINGLGDINNDGIADFAVGARGGNGNTYVVLGHSTAWADTLDLTALNGANGFKIVGAASGDQQGASVAAAGDFNGDGHADILVSSPFADPSGRGNAGAIYVVYGNPSGFGGTGGTINLSALGTNGIQIIGPAANAEVGFSVHSAGDVNGDGFDDIIIGAAYAAGDTASSGAAYVVYGKASNTTVDLSALNPATTGFKISGIANSDLAGISVSGGGDVNGDGYADVIVGARHATTSGFPTGAAYVVFGGANASNANVDLASLGSGDGSKGFELDGRNTNYFTGGSVSMADVNGDGLSDLVVGAQNSAENTTNAGSTYVMFGKESTTAVNLTGTSASQTLVGSELNDTLNGVSGNDTIYGNGGDDLITAGAGTVHLYGGAGNDAFAMHATLDNTDHIDGGAGTNDQIGLEGDYSGGTLVLSGLNITGVEVVAMLPGFDYAISTADDFLGTGQTFTFWSVTMSAANRVSLNTSAEADGNYHYFLGAGFDQVISGGGNDLIYGEGGQDTLTGGGGADIFAYLAVSESTGDNTFNSNDRITDFVAGTDKFRLPVPVTGIDTAITVGGGSTGTANADLEAAVNATNLQAHHAVLYTPDSGTAFALGKTFLIVDANGVAGYQHGADFLFDVTGGTFTGLATTDFNG